jgi:hypothetical protein
MPTTKAGTNDLIVDATIVEVLVLQGHRPLATGPAVAARPEATAVVQAARADLADRKAAGHRAAAGRKVVVNALVAMATLPDLNAGKLPLLCPRSTPAWRLRKEESNPWHGRLK